MLLLLAILLLGLLVLYYVLLVRALLEMLRSNVNPILLTFGFLSPDSSTHAPVGYFHPDYMALP